MKFLFFNIIILLLIPSLNAISLRTAVVKTLDSNPDILSEKLNRDAFKKYVDEEEGDYYPTLDLEAYAEDSRTRSDRDDEIDDPSYADKDGWNVALDFEQIIYDGGLTPSEVEQYRHRYLSNKHRSTSRVEEILRNTINHYMNIVKSQELLDLSQINIKVHDDYLIMAQEKEDVSGEILETYQVNSKKHLLLDRYNSQEINRIEFQNRLVESIGINDIGNVCRPEINVNLIPKTLNKALEDVLRKSPKILKAMEDIKEQRENIVQANAANLPTLSFQWKGILDDDLAYAENGRQDISRFRLFLSWNLFEGGKDRVAKEREVIFLQEKQKILDTIVNEVTQEMKTTYRKYFNHKAKIQNYKRYVQDNINIKEVYVKQLSAGTRTFIDILNAESEYYRSSLDLIDFEYELFGYYFDILQQRGILGSSILMSDRQRCLAFEPTKYVSAFKKQEDNSELEDLDLLRELGESDENASLDMIQPDIDTKAIPIVDEEAENNEINSLINDDKTLLPNVSDVKKEDDNFDDLMNKGTDENDEKKNLEFPEGRYTINLASFDEGFNVEDYFAQFDLDEQKLFIYQSSKKIHVLYGNSNSLMQITTLLNSLDRRLVNGNVYIDTLKKHQKVFEKFKPNNQTVASESYGNQ